MASLLQIYFPLSFLLFLRFFNTTKISIFASAEITDTEASASIIMTWSDRKFISEIMTRGREREKIFPLDNKILFLMSKEKNCPKVA